LFLFTVFNRCVFPFCPTPPPPPAATPPQLPPPLAPAAPVPHAPLPSSFPPWFAAAQPPPHTPRRARALLRPRLPPDCAVSRPPLFPRPSTPSPRACAPRLAAFAPKPLPAPAPEPPHHMAQPWGRAARGGPFLPKAPLAALGPRARAPLHLPRPRSIIPAPPTTRRAHRAAPCAHASAAPLLKRGSGPRPRPGHKAALLMPALPSPARLCCVSNGSKG
jgi:hypothetical protein